ncbi:class I SAM-dependent methyltransferase [Streptosporangium amethystogenes]|uniref:class I SAM-dependent methyltransferase n=1 Tax=Streptosporangium amethystogenes TaxID=2002 RepID=UPI00379DF49B
MVNSSVRDTRSLRYWERQAGSYDRRMEFAERRFFAGSRPWLCGQASGDTLEVAVGTGMNLAHYPEDVRLTGVEWSAAMLAVARRRAGTLGRTADLWQGDARALTFPDESFDTVVCTFSLCGISDERVALEEMARVLKPGGLLLLADHVASSSRPLRMAQRLVDLLSVPTAGEHYCRRPLIGVREMGFAVERHERFKAGVIERFTARRPAAG